MPRIHAAIARTIVAAAALLVLTAPCAGESPGGATVSPVASATEAGPEALFERFMGLSRAGDWEAVAKLMDPDAVAEFARLLTLLVEADESGETARMFLGVEKVADVAALPAETIVGRSLENIMAMQPGVEDALRSSEAAVLGVVPEGPVAHVVYRIGMKVEGAAVTKVAVASFKKSDGGWRALLTGEIEGLVHALRAQFAGGS